MGSSHHRSLPPWLHKPLISGGGTTGHTVKQCGVCTVCEEARCPNLPECYREKRATFLLLGPFCTRTCGFCNVRYAKNPSPPDDSEPERVAECCRSFALRHVVLTMVTRDDLSDGGAGHVASTICAVRRKQPAATVEVLTSDFGGSHAAVDIVLEQHPEVFAHNIETVRSLTPRIRSVASYEGSIAVLRYVKETNPRQVTKSSLMVGLGETFEEVVMALRDLRSVGVNIVTIGQYLQPSAKHMAVKEWVHPTVFRQYEDVAQSLGIARVVSGPFVRSSYQAAPLEDHS
jgi:lipoyl synthase